MAMQLLRLPDALERTGLSRSGLYAAIAAGNFPKPVKLGPNARAIAWPSEEIDAWIAERIAEREAA
jgi:prophage regulatory protein